MRNLFIISNNSWNLYNFRYELIEKLSEKYKLFLFCNNDEYANIFIEALKKFKHKFLLYTLNNSIIETICKKKKVNFCSEHFFDRRYDSKRQLINRSEKDALLIDPDEAISQFNNLIDFEELKKNNKRITVCIHMDGKNSINMARKLRQFIDSLDS